MGIENIIGSTYINYEGKIQIDATMLIVALWNKLIEEEGKGCIIHPNSEEFFKNSFDSTYDAAQVASAGNYRWTDEFVYIDEEGHLMSFSLLDDETCPIDIGRIAIGSLINELQEMENKNERYVVNGISPAIHDALQEI